MRAARRIGMNGQRKDKRHVVVGGTFSTFDVVFGVFGRVGHVLAIEVVKVVFPELLDGALVDPAVRVGYGFHEHHGREIVEVPVCGDLNEARGLAFFERVHPGVRGLVVVDFGPGVAGAEVVGLAVVVGHGVIVLDAVGEKEFGRFFADFPPRCYGAWLC